MQHELGFVDGLRGAAASFGASLFQGPKWKADPAVRKDRYLDARDLDRIMRLAVEKDGLRFSSTPATTTPRPIYPPASSFGASIQICSIRGNLSEKEALYLNRKG